MLRNHATFSMVSVGQFVNSAVATVSIVLICSVYLLTVAGVAIA